MYDENTTIDKFNANLKITFYVPREQVLKLNNRKNAILEDYNIRIPVSEFFRDAINDFLVFPFASDETLKEDIKFYLTNKGLI